MSRRFGPALALLALLLVSACAATQPTRFYTLSSLRPTADEASAEGPVIGLEPVILPDYLDRPQIVTRAGPNRMMLADFDVWVEPLSGMFTRVLAQNLSVLLETEDVVILPELRDVRFDHQVQATVTQFDIAENGQAVLDALWAVYGRDGRRLVRQDRSRITEAVAEAGDYAAVAAALSRALEGLSRDIAGVIRTAGS
jgi:uncharacterized lipoprotein YmbA